MEETKFCNFCQTEKPLSSFYKNKNKSDGRSNKCIACTKDYKKKNSKKLKEQQKEYDRMRNLRDKEKRNNQNKEWRESNSEYIREKRKERYKIKRDEILKKQKEYRERDKDKVTEWRKNYKKNNREEINKRYRKQSREKRITNEEYLIRERLRVRVGDFFRKSGIKKPNTTNEIVGASYNEVLTYLKEKGFNKEIHDIDHIVPLSAFNMEDLNHQKIAFHYLNLQPLDSYINQNEKKDNLPNDWQKIIFIICDKINIKAMPIIGWFLENNV